MADVTITAANVAVSDATASTQMVTAGESITQGQTVYKNSTDSKYYKADADNTAATATVLGIALTPAAADGVFVMARSGPLIIGGTVVAGTIYICSDTPGGIKPNADAATGDYVTILGVASSATVLDLSIDATGVQVP